MKHSAVTSTLLLCLTQALLTQAQNASAQKEPTLGRIPAPTRAPLGASIRTLGTVLLAYLSSTGSMECRRGYTPMGATSAICRLGQPVMNMRKTAAPDPEVIRPDVSLPQESCECAF